MERICGAQHICAVGLQTPPIKRAFDESNNVYEEVCRHLLANTKKSDTPVGNVLNISPEDVIEVKIKETGERYVVLFVLTPDKLIEMDTWSEENPGERARITAGEQTLSNSIIREKMSTGTWVYPFQSKEEAKMLYEYLLGK